MTIDEPAVDTWRQDAACARVDPDLFFPERGGDTKLAKAVCATCPVADECLEYALTNNEKFGIWGGKSERQRRHLRRERFLVESNSPQRPCRECATPFVRSTPHSELCNDCGSPAAVARRAYLRRREMAS